MFFNKLLKPAVLTIACAAALTAGSFGNVSVFPEAHAQTSQLSGLPDFTKLVEDNGKAVVSISTVRKAKRVGPQNGMPDEQLEMLRRFGFPFPFGDFNGPASSSIRTASSSRTTTLSTEPMKSLFILPTSVNSRPRFWAQILKPILLSSKLKGKTCPS